MEPEEELLLKDPEEELLSKDPQEKHHLGGPLPPPFKGALQSPPLQGANAISITFPKRGSTARISLEGAPRSQLWVVY